MLNVTDKEFLASRKSWSSDEGRKAQWQFQNSITTNTTEVSIGSMEAQ